MPSLKRMLRGSLGGALPGVSALTKDKSLKSGEALLRRKRVKVAIFAIIFGIVSAVIEMPLPAEDAFRLARSQVRARMVPQDVAMIAIDDATLNELGVALPTRKHESELIDRLVAAGVRKVVFDRAHADPETPETDAQFAEALERHKGKVWLGMSPEVDLYFQKVEAIVPQKMFRDHASMATMVGFSAPFNLSVVFPTEVELAGSTYPSISAVLADYEGPPARYRPDFAYNPKNIPTYRYADVLRGRIAADRRPVFRKKSEC